MMLHFATAFTMTMIRYDFIILQTFSLHMTMIQYDFIILQTFSLHIDKSMLQSCLMTYSLEGKEKKGEIKQKVITT